MELLKAKISLKDSFKITALLDINVKIHIMIKELIKKDILAKRKGPKLEFVSHIDHSRPFLGLYKDIKVAIRRLKTRHPIFIVKTEDHDLVLGQFLLNSVKFNQEYKLNGILDTITHLKRH